MEANKILDADILDIIFEGRNKAYGAYELRKNYGLTLRKALIITMSVLLLIIGISVLATVLNKGDKDRDIDVLDTEMAEIKKDEPPPPPPPPPPKPPPPPEVNQVKFTPPKIVKPEEVKPDEKIEDIKEDQKISDKTVESDIKDVVQAPVEDQGSKVVEAPAIDYENTIFTKVEVDASFPGGEAAWTRYLRNNLDPQIPMDNNAPAGTYQVIVLFIVSQEGVVSNVKAETNHGYGMEDEAVKIIKKGPKWTPAIQNGRQVKAYRRQPITFVLTGE